jgi:hypothetical protein
MNKLGKNLRIVGVVAIATMCSTMSNARANTSSDDLYSETIYIQKSSAEVPTSLESNARPNAEMELAAASDKAIESMSDLDNSAKSPKAKNVSQRRNSKKASNN